MEYTTTQINDPPRARGSEEKSLPKGITNPFPQEQNSWTLTAITLCDTSSSMTSRFFFVFAACVLPLREHWVTSPFAGAQIVQSLKKIDITLTNTAPNNNNNNSSENFQGSSFSVKYTISALIFMGNVGKHNPKWKTKQNR